MATLRTVVTNPAASYTALNAPLVNPPFESNLTVITLESGSGATISFDGITDDFILATGALTSVNLPVRLTKIWVKAAAAAVVSAWQTDHYTAH